MSPLRRRMIEDMQIRNLTPNTQRAVRFPGRPVRLPFWSIAGTSRTG